MTMLLKELIEMICISVMSSITGIDTSIDTLVSKEV